ncbi:MAG TPA: bifunctional transaldolase/phosoglucose isomerase [Terriglobales bacterium]|nr:bifunctional transaldolase/phosoglucose isomerase [Terriglobales bacterium]
MNPVATTAEPAPAATSANRLMRLQEFGQSVWLDYIRRSLITSGELQRFVDQDGLRGVTSNPAIFEKAITGSTDYANILKALAAEDLSPEETFERIAIRDIQDAADVLYPVYQKTGGRDGYVSLEVSPRLAKQTQATIGEARRLWQEVGRENLMIKVPGTSEGLPAIRQLISEGINVNVTLLFAQGRYEEVAEAFLAGLEARLGRGGDLGRIASVASFFVSRIDSAVDALLAARLKGASGADTQRLRPLLGRVAIANAKLAYQAYKRIFSGERWQKLAAAGAQTQRLLWASTSSKNPAYRDVVYVESLIGADTVNTIPPATYDAFRDHGELARTLDADLPAAQQVLADLERVGISLRQVADNLLEDGIKLFAEAFDKLLAAVARTDRKPASARIRCLRFQLPEANQKAFRAALEDWRTGRKVRRLWSGDISLWTGSDESNWLGWLGITEDQISHLHELSDIAEGTSGLRTVLLLGMGGSSLAPEVLKMTFGPRPGHPELHVLDSTDPAQIKAFEEKIDPRSTLFIVSSKSGSTLEPNIFKQYFFEVARKAVGAKAGEHFLAITDPGSKMQKVAEADGFRRVCFGVPSIGGRYSALSNFGMVPAAVMGLDLKRFLDRTEEMVQACTSSTPVEDNPGAVLGLILGTLGRSGRDKVTLISSPGIHDLGAWLEQLLAESTGKDGRGLIPVDGEQVGPPEVYGDDRVFVYLRLAQGADPAQDAGLEALEKAGQPVVRIEVADIYDLGQEFFRWEIATAVAGSILGINPFNQPDVEASKIATRALTEQYEKTGALPAEQPFLEEGGIRLFADERNATDLLRAARHKSLSGMLRAHLDRIGAGDYLALLAYVHMNQEHEQVLQAMRHEVRDRKRVATCLGFGPRFLHSTGQAYKGGPNTGVFLQVTCDDAVDLPVPGQKYTFGVVKAAQARGDFTVLAQRNRRALRVHLPADVAAGLRTLQQAVQEALA